MSVAFIADRRLCLTADRSRIVEENTPDAAFLFVVPGHPISLEDAGRFGLTLDEGRVRLPGEEPTVPRAPQGNAADQDAKVDPPAEDPPADDPPPKAPKTGRRTRH